MTIILRLMSVALLAISVFAGWIAVQLGQPPTVLALFAEAGLVVLSVFGAVALWWMAEISKSVKRIADWHEDASSRRT